MRPRRAAAEYTCTARRRREIARAEAARAVGAVGGGEEGAVELEVCPETVTVLPAHAAHAPGGPPVASVTLRTSVMVIRLSRRDRWVTG